MNSKIKYFVLIALLCGCGSNKSKNTVSNVKVYNEKLEELTADSTKKLNISLINAEYTQNGMSSFTAETIRDISNENSFKELLGTEKNLLDRWEQIAGFQNYPGKVPDTLIKLIRRCAAFDRAPLDVERLPSARGMRAISLDYYKIEVRVAFHIILNQKGEGELADMNTKINAQIELLNSVYNQFNITFKLNSIDRAVNDTWFDSASYYSNQNALKQMTTALSKEPARLMNVYTLSPPEILGEASYPWYDERGTSMDYIVINYKTLPGGPETFLNGDYDEGKTLVHEAGHFLGLYHTFEGGNFRCTRNPPHDGCSIGDQVDDTPSQLICYFDGCDENLDSCPAPGKDPVRNYMGYNPDQCMIQFTEGQGERLLQSIIKFRYYLVTNPI